MPEQRVALNLRPGEARKLNYIPRPSRPRATRRLGHRSITSTAVYTALAPYRYAAAWTRWDVQIGVAARVNGGPPLP
jgi:hypothetical protein